MLNNISNLFNWIYKNKNLWLRIFILIVLTRFICLNIYNWNHGNTGKPGIQYYIDSDRYIEGAEKLLHCEPLDYIQIQYSGYIAIIAFVKMFGLGLEFVIIIQLLMAILSSWFLYDMGKSITGNKIAGILAVGLYLANPFITRWHLYILTESLYTSLLILSLWIINKTVKKRTLKFYILSFIIVCINTSIRPNGWILLPMMFCFFIIYSKYNWYIKLAGTFTIITFFLMCVIYIPILNHAIQKVGSDELPINKELEKGVVIWGHNELCLNMPKDTNTGNRNWTESNSYIFKHPFACFKLAIYRVLSELLQINHPWYSVKYQIRILLWLFPAYLLAIIGIMYFKNKVGIKVAIFIILAHILIIALTWSEHDNRFLNYFLPLIYLLSGCGLYFILKKIKFPIKKMKDIKTVM